LGNKHQIISLSAFFLLFGTQVVYPFWQNSKSTQTSGKECVISLYNETGSFLGCTLTEDAEEDDFPEVVQPSSLLFYNISGFNVIRFYFNKVKYSKLPFYILFCSWKHFLF
jgi:hypothetical protein